MLNNEIAYAMQMNEDEIKKLGINVNSIKKIADKIERDILKKTSSQNLHNDYKFKDLKSILSKIEIYIDIFQQENLKDGNISYYEY